jgi:hypothetical protein
MQTCAESEQKALASPSAVFFLAARDVCALLLVKKFRKMVSMRKQYSLLLTYASLKEILAAHISSLMFKLNQTKGPPTLRRAA